MEQQADKKILIDGQVVEILPEVPVLIPETKPKEEHEEEESEESEETSVFPLARIKKIIQLATSDGLRSDSVKLLSKATVIFTQQLFIQEFANKTYQFTKSKNKKTIMLSDIIEAVATHENLAFLKDSGILSHYKSSQEDQTISE